MRLDIRKYELSTVMATQVYGKRLGKIDDAIYDVVSVYIVFLLGKF